jgi:hypothetical protein
MKKRIAPKTVAKSHIAVKNSEIHGRGVFVKKDIPKGAAVIEYIGERISWKEALRRHPHDPEQPNHTFYFSLEDGRVIDANVGGNAARWINPLASLIARPMRLRWMGKAGCLFLQDASFFLARSFFMTTR